MRVHVQLSVDGQAVKEDVIVIEEHRLGDLTDEEITQAIEVRVRSWVDRTIHVEWESKD
jgi:hypothetical protein